MSPARPSPRTVRRLALASVVANSAIVVTGGAVRLTASGLGCPTWPRCTDETFTPTEEFAIHGVIEFGNRLLTFVLLAVVVAALVAVWRQRPQRPDMRRLAVLGVLGIPAQALLGGITVLTGLNPWTVMGHFLLSIVLITFATLAVGTVVTGSGPHSGDPAAGRTGLDPSAMSQLHADLVFLLVGVTVAFWVALKATGAPPHAVRAMGLLLAVELAQGVVGFAQYFTGLPVLLVGLHLVGACVIQVVAVQAVLALRDRGPLGARPLEPERARTLTPA